MNTYTSTLLIFLVTCTNFSTAQQTTFKKTYGSAMEEDFETAEHILSTSDSNFVIIGHTTAYKAYGFDVLLLKINRFGDVIWRQTFDATGSQLYDQGWSGKETSDGDLIIIGSTQRLGLPKDAYCIKTDADGNLHWQKTYGSSFDFDARSIVETNDGGYLIAGSKQELFLTSNAYIMKIDSMGNELWTKEYGGPEDDFLHWVESTNDGGFIATGMTKINGVTKLYLLRLDSFGNSIWENHYGDTLFDMGYSVYESDDKGFVAAGVSASVQNASDIFLLKTDSTGLEIWSKRVGGQSDDGCYAVQPTKNDGIIAVGYTYNKGSGNSDSYLLKFTKTGKLEWDSTYGDANWQMGRSVKTTSEKGYIMAGYSKIDDGFEFLYDVYVIKTDSLGRTNRKDSTFTGIPSQKLQNEILVYPNPFNQFIKIDWLSGKEHTVEVRLLNTLGELIIQKQIPVASNRLQTLKLDLNKKKLTHGLYLVQIISKSGLHTFNVLH